jgi:Spy/CpxP family protein refolding chaperone
VRRALLVAALAALAVAPGASAAGMPDGKWWKNPRVTAELGLTPEQSTEIEKVFVRSRAKLIDLKADLEKKQLDLQVAREDKTADRGAVEKKIESVENARAALQKTRALMILDMKEILKPAQWERLVQRQQERREQMQERRRMFREEGARPGPGPRPQGRRSD